jgi:phage tail protein X
MQVITQQDDTVDRLCWRHLQRTAGVVEAVLEAHPGLADAGPFLPQGIEILLPDSVANTLQQPLLQLWD